VYSPEEQQAVQEYRLVWDRAANDVPDYAYLADIRDIESWKEMRAAAGATLEVFNHRGRLSNDLPDK